jgi:C-terminal processing protease CtpA/Prc
MSYTKNHLFLLVLLGIGILSSCKKDDVSAANPAAPTAPTTVSAADKIKDTTLSYTRDIYLWYGQIPASFNPRTYEDPSKIMTAIRQYSNEIGFSGPVDRWSFASKKQEWDNVSSGISGDFGITVFFRAEGDLRVRSVEPESPAGKAGIRRGWRITKISGNDNITTSNANFIIQNVYENTATSFEFQKPDNSVITISLNATTYRDRSILVDSVYEINGKRIGYFVFNSFLGDTSNISNEFNRVFNRFSSSAVNDVIVDLRYNGGGYVSIAEQLGNYLVPSSATGSLMMKQEFNNKYSQYNSIDNFKKQGSLNLSRVFFIVSSSTASASELVINNLRPYMDVILLGPSKTYGKPVGFFPIPVGDLYIFPVSFRTVNKNGEGNYYNGLPLNNQVADGLDKDWGDTGESVLKNTISYISNGVFNRAASTEVKTFTESPAVKAGNVVLDRPAFKGVIDTRGMK